MAGYFGVEIILGVGVNWLGQTYVFAQASEILGGFHRSWVNT